MRRGLICALALLAGAAPANADVPVGISDQSADAFWDLRLAELHLGAARLVVPWDAALTPSAEVDVWLRTAHGAGYDVLVSFERRRGETCPHACRLPTAEAMRAAFEAFRARWPQVTAFSTWNEGNHPGQPTAPDPAGAARLYETLAAACPTCRILAAEVLDTPGMVTWVRRFRDALPSPPRLWGLHNYGDVTRGRSPALTDALLSTVEGRVWITETGGIVRHIDTAGQLRWPYDEERARASLARALDLANQRADRVERVFVYHWRAGAQELWDSGLVRPDGSLRPAYHELFARLRRASPPAPGASRPAPRRSARPRVLRRPWLTRRGVVRARVQCPAGSARPCAVRLTVRTKPSRRRAPRRLGADHRRRPAGATAAPTVRVPARRLGTRSARVTAPPTVRVPARRLGADSARVAAGATATLAVRLPASRRRLIRQGRTTELLAELRSAPSWQRRFVVRCRL